LLFFQCVAWTVLGAALILGSSRFAFPFSSIRCLHGWRAQCHVIALYILAAAGAITRERLWYALTVAVPSPYSLTLLSSTTTAPLANAVDFVPWFLFADDADYRAARVVRPAVNACYGFCRITCCRFAFSTFALADTVGCQC
jgi:hypothetical protein